MNIGDDYEIIQDQTAPKGRRIVKKGQVVEKEVTGFDDMTDDELRDEIEALTGTRPHHRTGRAKLVEQWTAAYGS